MESVGICKKGLVRVKNEDYIYMNDDEGLFIVADGMGGHFGGEIASKLAVNKFLEKFNSEKSEENDILTAFNYANSSIMTENDGKYPEDSMGTTLSALYIRGEKGYIGHIGDSRVYLIRNQSIEQLTEDHTYVKRLLDEGLISEDEFRHHPKRNILLKALGSSESIEPQIINLKVNPGDKYLICSDGVFNHIEDQEILDVFLSNSLEVALEKLANIIEKRGARDNYSMIVKEV